MKTLTRLYILLLSFLLISPQLSRAATYYWVGGSGNWSDYANHWATSSGGTVFHASIPTINDDVIIDNQSFTASGQSLVLDSTFYYCKSMDWTGVQFTPELQGNGATLYIYGSFTLDAAMTINYTDFVLRGNGTGNSVTTAGQHLDLITFDAAGEYLLGDPIFCTRDITIQSGCSFDANGFDITCRSFTADTGTTVTTGDITINLDGLWNDAQTYRRVELKGSVVNSAPTNLFFHCNIGYIQAFPNHLTVDSITFSNTGFMQEVTANYISAPASSNIYNSIIGTAECGEVSVYLTTSTFDTLRGHSFVFNGDTTTITVNNLFDLQTDCNNFGSLISFNSSTGYGVLKVPSGTVNVSWAAMSGIHTSGGATFNATNIVDNGFNAGWNLVPISSRDLYWIGGSGNWNDPAHWSLSSGGTSIGCTPTQIDNVFFDANSFTGNDTISINTYQYDINNITFSGLTTHPRLTGTILNVYGSVTLDSSLIWDVMDIELQGSATLQTISTSGCALQYIEFLGGDYQLQDLIVCDELWLEGGSLNISGRSVQSNLFHTYTGTTLDANSAMITTGELNLEGSVIGQAYITMDRAPAVILSPGTFSSIEFLVDGKISAPVNSTILNAHGAMEIDSNCIFEFATFEKDVLLHGNNTLDTLYLFNGGHTFSQDPGKTLTVNYYLNANGFVCNQLVTLRSTTSGQQTTISSPLGTGVYADYIQLSDIHATGGAVFVATNSVDAGNNSGWNINGPAARTVYWVGGSGVWSSPNNWSLSSGGTPGACTPSAIDNAIFDANSGISGGTLTIDVSNAAVHDLDFTNAGSAVSLAGENLTAFGSVALAPDMSWSLTTFTMHPGAANANLTTAGNKLLTVVLNGTGTVSQTDELYAKQLDIQTGGFNVNGHNLSVSTITGATGTNFISGPVTITTADFYLQGTVSNTTSTDFILQRFPAPYSINNLFLFRTNGTFRDITVMESGLSFNLVDVNCRVLTAYGSMAYSGYATVDTIQKLVAFDDLTLGFMYLDTLFLNNPGHTANIISGITVANEFNANGTPAFPVLLQGTGLANITKTSGQVCLSDVLLSSIPASGGAMFYAGDGCVDLGGNTGWQFIPCTVTSDVWPGDANYDLNCDNLDILNIGIAFSEAGPTRFGASNSWTAQPAADFASFFSSGVNMKHADCDGSGTVDYSDTLAVTLNYGQNHPARLINEPEHFDATLPPLMLIASPDTVAPSATVTVEMLLGNTLLPVDSLYGIAFTVYYDPALINTTSLHTNFSGSWLGTPGVDLITYVNHNPAIGRIDFALVRTDHQNIYNGNGHLGLFDVVVVDNISTVTDALFRLTDVTAITYTQFPMAVSRMDDSVMIDPLLSVHPVVNLASDFYVYPNPAKDQVTIHSHDVTVKLVQLYDIAGRELRSIVPAAGEIKLSLDGLPSGIYQLRCRTDKGDYNTRVQVAGR